MDNYIKIFTNSHIIVQRLNTLLQEQNIDTLIKDNKESARLAGFGELSESIDLYVLASSIERAKPILQAFKNELNA